MATSNTPADASAAICAKEEEEEAEEEKEEADAFVGRGHKTPPQTRCTRLREAEAVIDAKVGKHSKDRRPSILAGGWEVGRRGWGGVHLVPRLLVHFILILPFLPGPAGSRTSTSHSSPRHRCTHRSIASLARGQSDAPAAAVRGEVQPP